MMPIRKAKIPKQPPLSEMPLPPQPYPPDPTVRTVEQLQREIATSREVVETSQYGSREVLETRIAAIEKAIELLAKTNDMIPQHIRDSVGKLEALHDEKFNSVDEQLKIQFDGISTQFQERDKRTEQLSLADKTAIAAALQAQKEAAGAQNESNTAAINKMEANFVKLIDQGQQAIKIISEGFDGKINDIKSRLDKGEGRSGVTDPAVNTAIAQIMTELRSLRGAEQLATGHKEGVSAIVAMVFAGIAAMAAILGPILLRSVGAH